MNLLVLRDNLMLAILLILGRLIATGFVLSETIRLLLRIDNSISTIRKTKKNSTRWKRLTALCFWHAKSRRPKLIRFFIALKIFALATSILPLILAPLAAFVPNLTPIWKLDVQLNVAVTALINIIIGRYALSLYNRNR